MNYYHIKIYDKSLKLVSYSRNLRGILQYSRQHLTNRIDLYKGSNGWSGGQFGIEWENGSTSICDFADFSIMQAFAKKRTFRNATINIHERG